MPSSSLETFRPQRKKDSLDPPLFGYIISQILTFSVCHTGGWLDRPRASVHHQGGAPQDDGTRRVEPSQHPGLCQQAGRQGMHVSRRDLQTTQPAVNAETQVANTGMLRAHRRRVRPTSWPFIQWLQNSHWLHFGSWTLFEIFIWSKLSHFQIQSENTKQKQLPELQEKSIWL